MNSGGISKPRLGDGGQAAAQAIDQAAVLRRAAQDGEGAVAEVEQVARHDVTGLEVVAQHAEQLVIGGRGSRSGRAAAGPATRVTVSGRMSPSLATTNPRASSGRPCCNAAAVSAAHRTYAAAPDSRAVAPRPESHG